MEKLPEISHRREIAYVMVNCESGLETSVLEELKSIDGIREIVGIIGIYDIILKIETSSVETLREVITARVRRAKNVIATTTLMCADSFMPMLTHST